MRLALISISSFILILNACRNSEKDINSNEEVFISSLRKSNEAISKLSGKNYRALQAKLKDVVYGDRVELWNNKALKLKALTDGTLPKIEIQSRNKNFLIDSVGYLKTKYINDVKLLDSSISYRFKNEMASFLTPPTIYASYEFIVEKTKNDFLLLESNLSAYFNDHVGAFIEDFTRFSTIVGQNTKHLKSSETLEISAGIGSFSMASNPLFIVNGDTIKPDEGYGCARYRLKVSGKGKKNIPVKILYTSNKGLRKTEEFTLEYYVDE